MADRRFDQPIRPDAIDNFTFDYTDALDGSGVIQSVAWTCAVSSLSLNTDPNPASRIQGTPSFTNTTSTALVGTMIDGVIYTLTCLANIDDGRRLPAAADLACILQAPEPVLETAGTALFNYETWVTRYPEFEGVDPAIAQSLWNEATLFLRNDPSSQVDNVDTRAILLYMLTAHLAQLNAGPGGMSGMVGRINSKSVNGVSVSAEGFGGVYGTQAWFLTTRYGSDYWRATAAFRTMHYIPGPSRFFGSWPFPRPY